MLCEYTYPKLES